MIQGVRLSGGQIWGGGIAGQGRIQKEREKEKEIIPVGHQRAGPIEVQIKETKGMRVRQLLGTEKKNAFLGVVTRKGSEIKRKKNEEKGG